MKVKAAIRELDEWFDVLHRADPVLMEEIVMSSLPTRLFREGARVEADILLEPTVRALSKGVLKEQQALPGLMKRFYRNVRLAGRQTRPSPILLDEIRAARAEWATIKAELGKSRVEGAQDFISWFDRDVEELSAIASKRGKLSAVAPRATRGATTAVERKISRTEARRVYDAFVTAAAASSPRTAPALLRLGFFLGHNDPVWLRVADAVATLGTKDVDVLASRLQGIIGEALALRHPWVSRGLAEAADHAKRVSKALGPDWKIVFVEAETYATKTRGAGLGQLYDSSVWIAKKDGSVAAPIWALEVKSGAVVEAPEQIAKDFGREIGGSVRLPTGKGQSKEHAISNLRALLEKEGVDLQTAGLGDASTRRILVAPRAPTDKSLAKHLPRGVAIDYVPGLMSKSEMNQSAKALAKALQAATKP